MPWHPLEHRRPRNKFNYCSVQQSKSFAATMAIEQGVMPRGAHLKTLYLIWKMDDKLSFIFLPDGEDPDTYIRQYGKEKFEEYIDQAQSLTEFLFAHLSPQVDFSTQEGRGKLVALACL